MSTRTLRIALIAASIVLVCLFLLVAVLQRTLRPRQSTSNTAPSITLIPTVQIVRSALEAPIQQETEEYDRAQEQAMAEMRPTIAELERSFSFRESLPYESSTLQVWYDEYERQYVVQYLESDSSAARRELQQLLNEHGIKDLSALENYKIQNPRE